MRQKRNWVVDVSVEDDNPVILGPYLPAVAERIAERLNDRYEQLPQEDREGNYLYATAHPLPCPNTLSEVLLFFGLETVGKRR